MILQDWYAQGEPAENRLDRIEASGEEVVMAKLQQLVDAMAAWSAENGTPGDQIDVMPKDDDNLNAALAAAWKPLESMAA